MRDAPTSFSLHKVLSLLPFSLLTPMQKDRLASIGSVMTGCLGQILLSPGDSATAHVYVIASGRVQVSREGATTTDLGAGAVFPTEVFSLDYWHPGAEASYLVAEEGTTLWVIERKEIRALQSHSKPFHEYCQQHTLSYAQPRGTALADRMPGGQHLGRSLRSMVRKAAIARLDDLASEALRSMPEEARHIVVVDGEGTASGLIGPDEVMTALRRWANLEVPCESLMAPVDKSLHPSQTAFDASIEMACQLSKVAVVAEAGVVIGVIEEMDIVNSRPTVADLATRVASASSRDALVQISHQVHEQVAEMAATGIAASRLCALSGMLHDQIVRRMIAIAVAHHPNLPDFCWLSLGSEARQERTLASDQDNAILFEASEGLLATERGRLMAMAAEVTEGLGLCGFALCDGRIMASEPACCLTAAEWRERFQGWIFSPDQHAILNASIYFDMRPVYGHMQLADPLLDWLTLVAASNKVFLMHLMSAVLEWKPPLGLLRDFVVDKEDDCIDLKAGGTTIVTGCARVLGLLAGIHPAVPSTVTRIEVAQRAGVVSATDAANWSAAFEFVQGLRIRTQKRQIAEGLPPSNRVNPNALDLVDRKGLLESLKQTAAMQKALAVKLGAAR